MASITRRSFIQTAAMLGASAAWGNPFSNPLSVQWHERRDLYAEGVASGDPDSNSVLLWTRHAPMIAQGVNKLTLEVAEDEMFQHVIATQQAPISADEDWT